MKGGGLGSPSGTGDEYFGSGSGSGSEWLEGFGSGVLRLMGSLEAEALMGGAGARVESMAWELLGSTFYWLTDQ